MNGPRRQRVAPAQRSRHGLAPDRVLAMLERQGGLCLICRRAIDATTRVIDHDHSLARLHGHGVETGCPLCVRGLLCRDCNLLLGHAHDQAYVLRRAAAYLEEAAR